MKKRYKLQVFFVIIISFYLNIGFAQTFVGLNIGGDYYDVSSEKASTLITLADRNKGKSFLVGLYLEHNLYKKIKLLLRSDFTIKKHGAYSGGISPVTGYKYKSFNTTFLLNWNFINNFHLGIGGGLNRIFDSKLTQLFSNDDDEIKETKNIIEGITGISYNFKNFSINLYYNYGFNFSPEGFPEFDKFSSVVFSLGYKIKVFDKKGKNKGKDCPEF